MNGRRLDSWLADGIRFVGAGTANTILTLALYQLLLFILSPVQAYALAWAIGFLLVTLFYPSAVFWGARKGGWAHFFVAAVYLASFILGIVLLRVFVDVMAASRLAIFVTIPVTSIFSFAAMRLLLRRIDDEASEKC